MDHAAGQSYIDIVPGLQEQAQCVSNRFCEQFGQEPQWLAAAPGRVNMIGEHTDYNDGFVLPMAIDRYVVMAGAAASGQEFNAFSLDMDDLRSFRADDPDGRKNGDWSNYLRGVVDGCKAAGLWAGPLNLALQSNVPIGGGLSIRERCTPRCTTSIASSRRNSAWNFSCRSSPTPSAPTTWSTCGPTCSARATWRLATKA